MRRMAQTNLKSAAGCGPHKSTGVIGGHFLERRLGCIQIGLCRASRPRYHRARPKAPIAWLGGVLAVLLVMIALGRLPRHIHTDPNAVFEPTQSFREGNELMAGNRYPRSHRTFSQRPLHLTHQPGQALPCSCPAGRADKP